MKKTNLRILDKLAKDLQIKKVPLELEQLLVSTTRDLDALEEYFIEAKTNFGMLADKCIFLYLKSRLLDKLSDLEEGIINDN